MGALSEVVSNPEKKPAVVHDAAALLDDEVASKSGITGLAVKAAFTMVKAVRPGIIPHVIEGLLPDFATALDPILEERPAGTKAGAHLLANQGRVAAALLSVTDERARHSPHVVLLKAYQKLRPAAEKHVTQGLPRLARLVDQHLGG